MIPLDRNESYWLLDAELIEAARAGGAREFSTYPDYLELKEAIAAYAGVAPEQVLVTPGSDAAIEHLAHAYVGTGGEVVLPVPTFYGYEHILDRAGVITHPVVYEERGELVFPLAQTLAAFASPTAKALFLCHPNNPLGCALTSADVSALVAAAAGREALVVSDEAYFEFSGATFLPHLSALPNLVLIRTLSKGFALSGARVGYLIAAPEIVQTLERRLLPWAIAHPSVAAALALLSRADAVKARRELVLAAREQFAAALRAISSIHVYPSETNFVLARVPDAARVQEALRHAGIRVAQGEPMSRFPEAKKLLSNTLRMAVPSPDDQPAILAILTQHFTN